MGVLGDSSIPAFQDALVMQLRQRPNLTGVNVVIGPPSPGVAQGQIWVALLEVEGTEKWAAMGRLQKEEDYRQTVYISVLTRDGEGDSTAGRNKAYAIRKEIADQLLADPTVNSTVWQAQVERGGKFEPRLGINVQSADGGTTTDLSWREAAVYFEILVKNRI